MRRYRMTLAEAEALADRLRADPRYFNVRIVDRCNGGHVVAAMVRGSGLYGMAQQRILWNEEEAACSY